MSNVKRTKEDVAVELLRLASEGCAMMSTNVDRSLVQSARRYYGSWKTAISQLGITQQRKEYKETVTRKESIIARRIWSDEAMKEALVAAQKLDITSTEFRLSNKALADAIDDRYGGLHKACAYFGVGKMKRESTDIYKYGGHVFEDVLGDILTDLDVAYTKEKRGDCIPDFIVEDAWYDAKLSEWTIHTCDTLAKYEPHCKSLTIVFLRGDKACDRMITPKTRLVNVSHYIKQLPRAKQRYYNAKLRYIEASVA